MATNRRVFLNLVGVGAASTAVNLSCKGIIEDGGLLHPEGEGGSDGTGGAGGPSETGGGSGTGGDGFGGSGSGGQGGARVDGTGGRRDAGTDLPRDTGTVGPDSGLPPRDAGSTMLPPGDIAAGNVSGLAVGGLNAVPNRTFAIGRDAMGVYALTLICTHQGCTAAPAGATGARQINCPCHGSRFDRNGAVIQGPAARPLVHFAVNIDAAGNIIVHTNTQVAATVRVAP